MHPTKRTNEQHCLLLFKQLIILQMANLNPWAWFFSVWVVFCSGDDFLFKSILMGCERVCTNSGDPMDNRTSIKHLSSFHFLSKFLDEYLGSDFYHLWRKSIKSHRGKKRRRKARNKQQKSAKWTTSPPSLSITHHASKNICLLDMCHFNIHTYLWPDILGRTVIVFVCMSASWWLWNFIVSQMEFNRILLPNKPLKEFFDRL